MLAALSVATLLAGIAPVRAEPTATILNNGRPENRVDLAIVGDGYTSAEQGKFHTDVDSMLQAMFQQEPFKEYKPYFNVHRIDVVSTQSGADHPERTPPISVATAFDATYNCNGIVRLICVNTVKVSTVVNANLTPAQRDLRLVIVNDPEYGGSGGAVAVASTEARVVELVLHELGHSFGQLVDEYGDGANNPTCSSSEPAAVNATTVTARSSIKWNAWIDAATPLPTTSAASGVPGLYEGAAYCDTGVYRPTYDSKMRYLDRPFEQINTEQLVRRAYNFVSPLDGSQPSASSVPYVPGGSQVLSVTPMSPATHALTVAWTIDGVAAGSSTQLNVAFSSLAPGSHTVAVRVHDATSMVRVDPTDLLGDSRSWTVVVPAVRAVVADFDGNGSTDISVFRPSAGQWLLRNQASQFLGASGDVPVACDYDGDGNTDVAVFRPSVGGWWVEGQSPVFHGLNGDIPVPGDYDGNGTCDMAVFRPAVGGWYVRGQSPTFYGLNGDIPVPADYDGNGSTDMTVFRPAVGGWYRNGAAPTFLGLNGDIPVPGDYDGNGTAETAIYRKAVGGWYVSGQSPQFLGLSGDIPQPGNYDGNATTDLAVYRPSSGAWFVGAAGPVFFGTTGDLPVPLPSAIRMAFP